MLLFFIIAVIAFILGSIVSYQRLPKAAEEIRKSFVYSKRYSLATPTELTFYRRLSHTMPAEYTIVPQAHLSSFLDERIKGQNWKRAFYAINGKSVDFLICKKDSLEPLFAIELDDYTHKRDLRIQRDEIVNNIVPKAGIPLIRFQQGEWDTIEMILDKLEQAANRT